MPFLNKKHNPHPCKGQRECESQCEFGRECEGQSERVVWV